MVVQTEDFVRVASMELLREKGSITTTASGHTLVLFLYGDTVYAVDNRCPHMGFPLDKGTVHDGILTCHWHHARFDLASGGTFDQFTDDVEAFPVEVHGDDIMVDLNVKTDVVTHQKARLNVGLERNLSLVIAKSVIQLLAHDVDPAEPFRVGLLFGAKYRRWGWERGLTTHAVTMNLLPFLEQSEWSRALYHGLADVASNSNGTPPRFVVSPLPTTETDIPTLKRWFQQFVEVRDSDAAERCIISAVRAGANDQQMADMLFSAVTDHRYLDLGHTLDFINKAHESLDVVGWEHAELVLTSLAPIIVNADRMEESNAWRHPIDLVAILEDVFAKLDDAVEQGKERDATLDFDAITPILLGDDPQAIADALLDALQNGVQPVDLAGAVAYTASLRIAHFHTSNEFPDWDTALHTFTFANGVHQGLRRVESKGLLRGIFDGAMSIYLDRFLNIPSAPLPQPTEKVDNPDGLLTELDTLLDEQQRVNQAGKLVSEYLYSDGDPDKLMATLGRLLLREDRNFHTMQCVEASFQQYRLLQGTAYADHVLIACARYLAAHAPTMRAQGQTYQIARRLSRGDKVFEG